MTMSDADGRTASPLIHKAVLESVRQCSGIASAMDREHCARPIARLRTCHSDVTKRHREGDWQQVKIYTIKIYEQIDSETCIHSAGHVMRAHACFYGHAKGSYIDTIHVLHKHAYPIINRPTC